MMSEEIDRYMKHSLKVLEPGDRSAWYQQDLLSARFNSPPPIMNLSDIFYFQPPPLEEPNPDIKTRELMTVALDKKVNKPSVSFPLWWPDHKDPMIANSTYLAYKYAGDVDDHVIFRGVVAQPYGKQPLRPSYNTELLFDCTLAMSNYRSAANQPKNVTFDKVLKAWEMDKYLTRGPVQEDQHSWNKDAHDHLIHLGFVMPCTPIFNETYIPIEFSYKVKGLLGENESKFIQVPLQTDLEAAHPILAELYEHLFLAWFANTYEEAKTRGKFPKIQYSFLNLFHGDDKYLPPIEDRDHALYIAQTEGNACGIAVITGHVDTVIAGFRPYRIKTNRAIYFPRGIWFTLEPSKVATYIVFYF